MNRRDFLKSKLAATAATGLPGIASASGIAPTAAPAAKADAMVLIWLPGGIAQTDTWDPKQHTPFAPGMKGSDLLGTCPLIPTAADGVSFGAGIEQLASVMDKGCVLRSLTSDAPFGDVHLKAQHHMMTGRPLAAGVKAPSMGAVVSHALGRRDPRVPAYIAIGREINGCRPESSFINAYHGPGCCGPAHAPFVIPDAAHALRVRHRGMFQLDERTIGNVPATPAGDAGQRFGAGCALAARLVEEGARFVQVEYPYEPFGGFDAHEYGAGRMVEMKRRIDAPIAQLVRILDRRGLLDRTVVVVASEFGRTVAHATIDQERLYGFHGHFSAASAMLFFGGGFKRGFAYGKTAEHHPMLPVENPVRLEDVHATIYKAMGVPADAHYVTEGRPFYVTRDGRGKAIDAMLA